MDLRIKNVAKIKSADLKLNGITVIAGNNNTGKSTIGKTVFSVFNSLADIETKIQKQKENMIYQVLLRKAEDFSAQEGVLSGFKISPIRLRRYARELAMESEGEKLRSIIQEYSRNIKHESEKMISDITEEIRRIKDLPEERLVKSAVSGYFDQIFDSEINNIYHADKDAVIEAAIKGKELYISFHENRCRELKCPFKILNSAVYLDNPFILDCLNNGTDGKNLVEWNTVNKLRGNNNIVDNVVQYNFIEDRMQEVLSRLNEVSSGSIQHDESRFYYYKDKNTNVKFSINNLSAGLKTFVIIKALLENGAIQEKDVLILDEPEIHLHPSWQMIYAEVIILLQKAFDLTIMLTTHSSHFLEALQLFAGKHGISEKCSYYLAEDEGDGCIFKDMSDDITPIYAQLVNPSILLDKIRYEVEDAADE